MDVILSFNNNEDILRLPILPSSFELQLHNSNSTVNITNLGDINLIGKTGLASISLESFFPAKEYHFAKYSNPPRPYDCVKLINKWRGSGRPIRIIITGTPINLACGIESFSYSEKDGTHDVYFKLALKEYRFLKTNIQTITTTPSGTKLKVPLSKRETKPLPKDYKAKKGETIYSVAKKITGNSSNYRNIAIMNDLPPIGVLIKNTLIKL